MYNNFQNIWIASEPSVMASHGTEEPSAENIAQAEEIKGQANEMFKCEKYPQAIELYSQCISLNPCNAVFYANRSIAYLRWSTYD